MTKQKGDNLRGRDIFFRPIEIDSCEIRRITLHPLTLLFIVLLTVAFVAFDAGLFKAHMTLVTSTFIWFIAVSQQILTYSALAVLWAKAQKRLRAPVIFLPLIGAITFLITYGTTVLHISWHTGRPVADIVVLSVFFNALLFNMVFEALYYAFVLPQIRRVIGGEGGNDMPPQPRLRDIRIAGKRFEIDQILTLRGQEHYVIVTTPDGIHRLRARLGDLVSQTSESDGVLAHRSYWVARQAITGLKSENGLDVILTQTGEDFPVARPRTESVRAWVSRHLPDVAPHPTRPAR